MHRRHALTLAATAVLTLAAAACGSTDESSSDPSPSDPSPASPSPSSAPPTTERATPPSSATAAPASTDPSAPPLESLRVGVIATGTANEVSEQYEKTAEDLSAALGGVDVEMVASTDYFAIVEGLRAEDLDMAFLGSLSYVLAAERVDIEPLAVGVDAAGMAGYHSYLITTKPDEITSPADLPGHTLALAGPLSTSGYLFPTAALAEAGVSLDDITVSQGGNHAANILATASGQVDAAFVDSVEYEAAVKRGELDPEQVPAVWESDRITGSPIVMRTELPEAWRVQVRDALLTLEGTEEFPLGIEKSMRLTTVDDATYDPIRALADAAGLSIDSFKK